MALTIHNFIVRSRSEHILKSLSAEWHSLKLCSMTSCFYLAVYLEGREESYNFQIKTNRQGMNDRRSFDRRSRSFFRDRDRDRLSSFRQKIAGRSQDGRDREIQ